jgi:hypothetical protein
MASKLIIAQINATPVYTGVGAAFKAALKAAR